MKEHGHHSVVLVWELSPGNSQGFRAMVKVCHVLKVLNDQQGLRDCPVGQGDINHLTAVSLLGSPQGVLSKTEIINVMTKGDLKDLKNNLKLFIS